MGANKIFIYLTTFWGLPNIRDKYIKYRKAEKLGTKPLRFAKHRRITRDKIFPGEYSLCTHTKSVTE